MRPRGDIVSLPAGATVAEAARRAIETGLTRLPLHDPDKGLDGATGLIHAKDLLAAVMAGRQDEPVVALARPVPRVPDSMLIDEALRIMRRGRHHMALVVDEHGTTVGLVTLEDIVEELVGEIEDEFDPRAQRHIRRDGDDWIVDGTTPISDLQEVLPIQLSDPHEATVGGYLLEALGRVPEPGEKVELDGYEAEVLEVDEARVVTVRLRERSLASE
jgi:CBS domain containing-hemolysin-like protein